MIMTSPLSQQPAASQSSLSLRCSSPWKRATKSLILSVSALQKCEKENNSVSSISTSEGTSHFQKDLEMLKEINPKIVLALKSRKFTDLDLKNVKDH
jgi:hypothetical protein